MHYLVLIWRRQPALLGGRQLIQQVGIIDTDDRMIPERRAPRAVAKEVIGSRRVAAHKRRGEHAQRDAARWLFPVTQRTGVAVPASPTGASAVFPTPGSPMVTMPQIPGLSTSGRDGRVFVFPSHNRPITGHGQRHLFLRLTARRATGRLAPPTLCALALATLTNRSSWVGQPMSARSVRPEVSVLNTIVDFMIVPFCATVVSSPATPTQPGRG